MTDAKVLVMSGYGLNCEEETAFAFRKAGADAKIVHINDLVDGHEKLDDYRVLAFPGGFSFGDDTGSGKAFANRLRDNLWNDVLKFVEAENLVWGACNGFQILVNLGLLPALDGKIGERQAALLHNEPPGEDAVAARYIARWVDVQFGGNSPWTKGIETISLPIAHGEGKFYAPEQTLAEIEKMNLVGARYVAGDAGKNNPGLPVNPNGTLNDIAGITDETGKVFGLMPHPERAIAFTHLPHWPKLAQMYRRSGKPLPTEGPGLQIFRNAVAYFK